MWWNCENVHLQIGHYLLEYYMFSIEMGGCDIVLGVEWLCTLGPILTDFKELTIQFQQEGQRYHIQGLTVGSLEIISFHRMENFLKKGHSGTLSQLHSIHVVETPFVHPNLQDIFSTPQGLPPSRGVHDHSIPLILGILPHNVLPYRHPFSRKNEIENIVQEFL
jgi:hypothetical protein